MTTNNRQVGRLPGRDLMPYGGDETAPSDPLMQATHQNSNYQAQPDGSDVGVRHADDWELSRRVAVQFLLGYGDHTRRAYEGDLRDFFAFARTLGTAPLSMRRGQLDLYARHLSAERGLAARTVSRRLAAVAGFFRWAVDEELLIRSPMIRVHRPKAPPHPPAVVLDLNDIRALLAGAQEHSPRAHCLVALLLLNALRISEILNADAHDLGTDRGHRVLRVRRKGGALENVPLAAPTAAALDSYLAGRGQGPLLLSRTGRRLDRTNAARLLRAVAQRVLPADRARRTHPHVGRHAALTAALDLGAALRDVQDFAGHASADTTRLYDDRRKALERSPTYLLAEHLKASPAVQ